jgi:hypothetical protein
MLYFSRKNRVVVTTSFLSFQERGMIWHTGGHCKKLSCIRSRLHAAMRQSCTTMTENPFSIRAIAWFIWRSRRIRRKLSQHRNFPTWVSDLTELVSPMRRLNLTFTTIAIATTPEHFFRLVPNLVRKRRKFYASPVQFFIGMLLALAAVSFAWIYLGPFAIWRDRPIPNWPNLAVLGGVALLTPVWMILFVLLLLIVPPIHLAIYHAGKRPLFTFPLDYQVYQRLAVSQYLWSLSYFSVFFLLTFPLVATLIWIALWANAWWLGYYKVIAVLSYATLLVKPYAAMLRCSVKVPPYSMIQYDLRDLREILTRPAAKINSTNETWRKYVADIGAEHRRLARDEARIRKRGATIGQRWMPQLNVDLAAAYSEVYRPQLEWLARWGQGTPQEHNVLDAALNFIVTHDVDRAERSRSIFEKEIRMIFVLAVLVAVGAALVTWVAWGIR